jgi:hypothetical protein
VSLEPLADVPDARLGRAMTAWAVRQDPELGRAPLAWERSYGTIVGHPPRRMRASERASWIERWAASLALRPSRERSPEPHPVRYRGIVDGCKVELHHSPASSPQWLRQQEAQRENAPQKTFAAIAYLFDQTRVMPAD